MDKELNRKVEEILGSLDGTRRASVPDFFYTRLKAKMEKGYEPVTSKSWILRPAYAVAGLVLILLINAAVIFKGSSTTTPSAEETALIETETLQSYAAEYRMNDNVTEELYK